MKLRSVTARNCLVAYVSLLMADSVARNPRFNVGDYVMVVGPGADALRGMRGVITELLPVDVVYRYRVRFGDGTSGLFFGFELELIQPEDKR